MFPRGASDARTKRETSCGTDATSDPAKALVIAYFRWLVADGYAQWHRRENGDIQFRLHTGETYLLAKTMIIRIA